MRTNLFEEIDKKSNSRIMLEHIDLINLSKNHTMKDISKLFGLNYQMVIGEMGVQMKNMLKSCNKNSEDYDETEDLTLIKHGAWTDSKEREYLIINR